MAKKPDTLPARVRKAIADSGLSHGELGRRSGVAQPVISRFASGERSVSAETLDRIVTGLGLRAELVPVAGHAGRPPGEGTP